MCLRTATIICFLFSPFSLQSSTAEAHWDHRFWRKLTKAGKASLNQLSTHSLSLVVLVGWLFGWLLVRFFLLRRDVEKEEGIRDENEGFINPSAEWKVPSKPPPSLTTNPSAFDIPSSLAPFFFPNSRLEAVNPFSHALRCEFRNIAAFASRDRQTASRRPSTITSPTQPKHKTHHPPTLILPS